MDISTTTRWSLEGTALYIAQAADYAGLSRSALDVSVPVYEFPLDRTAKIVFPTFFCPAPAPWLKALAHLVSRGIDVRLYMIETDADDATKVLAVRRAYPRFDTDMLDLLRSFAGDNADLLDDVGARIERAFGMLRLSPPQHGVTGHIE